MSTRTNALVSQRETGKITVSIIPVVAGCHSAPLGNAVCIGFVSEDLPTGMWGLFPRSSRGDRLDILVLVERHPRLGCAPLVGAIKADLKDGRTPNRG